MTTPPSTIARVAHVEALLARAETLLVIAAKLPAVDSAEFVDAARTLNLGEGMTYLGMAQFIEHGADAMRRALGLRHGTIDPLTLLDDGVRPGDRAGLIAMLEREASEEAGDAALRLAGLR